MTFFPGQLAFLVPALAPGSGRDGGGSGMGGMDMGGVHGMSGPMWMPTESPSLGRLLLPHLQPIPLLPAIGLLMLVGYLAGVVALHRRGISWPWWRTTLWVLGVLILLAVTATGVEGYGMMLFSVHMVQHMTLVMVVPIFLLAASPITLILRSLPTTGRRGTVRRGVLRTISSRPMRVLTSLPVRWLLFIFGLYGIYFTSIFDGLMSTVWGHNLMLLHFLGTGLLFFGPIVDADPWPHHSPPIMRLLEAFVSVPFHAFFGITVMSSTSLIATFFADPPRAWGIAALADQGTAGGIAWASSELPTMLLMGVILAQWLKSDQRAAARHDRTALRTDDAELNAYNARLQAIAESDRV